MFRVVKTRTVLLALVYLHITELPKIRVFLFLFQTCILIRSLILYLLFFQAQEALVT